MRTTQRATVIIGDTHIYYEMAGEGACLCLIHGDTMDTRVWDAQFEFFSQCYRVLRYDLRGFGKSAARTGTCAFERD